MIRPSYLSIWTGLVLTACVTLGEAQEKNARPRAGTGSPIVIRLRPDVHLAEAIITVGDVARVEGGLFAWRQQIAALDLAEQPFTSEGLLITPEQVNYRLRLAGFEPGHFSLQGANQVQVRPVCPQVTETGVMTAVRRALLSHLSLPGDQIHVKLAEPFRLPSLFLQPADKLRLESELPATEKLLGRLRVKVAVKVNDDLKTVIPVMVEVRLYQKVVVATGRIEKGEELKANKLHLESRLVDDINVLNLNECLGGKKARCQLLPGQVVQRAHLEPTSAAPPASIKARDTVKLVARMGTWCVTATGEALQDGQSGQLIRIRNLDSKTVVVGRIIGPGLVEVSY